jgi:hypothetical protein
MITITTGDISDPQVQPVPSLHPHTAAPECCFSDGRPRRTAVPHGCAGDDIGRMSIRRVSAGGTDSE